MGAPWALAWVLAAVSRPRKGSCVVIAGMAKRVAARATVRMEISMTFDVNAGRLMVCESEGRHTRIGFCCLWEGCDSVMKVLGQWRNTWLKSRRVRVSRSRAGDGSEDWFLPVFQ